MFPRNSPPGAGSDPIFERSPGPPHASRSRPSHLHVRTSIKFIPLASETSIGAMDPMNSDGMKDETSEMRAVALYASGLTRRICGRRRQSAVVRESVYISAKAEQREKPRRAKPGATFECKMQRKQGG